ncbi:MAG: putative dihydrolipoyllysine-residue acetyltransferase [Xanthobacteraceae bacterium]|nr:MAG: putative dihydrolipoyllysine-residue acetyltransferase [Xanthobacteraceae bacterium]
MAHDIIMPALGMAQDTGLLVTWRKAPGDHVAIGDALFEVETDKATMEVEATAEGYLSAVTAREGEDVPVGQVIARIVGSEAEVDKTLPGTKVAATPAAPQSAPASPAPPAPAAAPTEPQPVKNQAATLAPRPLANDGRILASPKARTIAAEQGLDLSRLVKAGHPQPYHVADLDRLRGIASSGRSTLGARVDGTALQALMKKASQADSARVLAAFAKGAWWQVSGEDISVTLMRPDGSCEDEGGALLLLDLAGTRLTSYAPPDGLVLSAATEGGIVSLTLTFDEAELPFATAAAWLNETAARIEDPVRQLI